MKCDGLVLERAFAGGNAKQRLEDKYTGTCEQAIYMLWIFYQRKE